MKVTTICDGFACSAASVIFMAGDERIINEASLLMIHNSWSCACGDSAKLRKEAEDLDKITQASVNAYMNRVNITEDEVKDLMDKETWITAEEAVSYGFATKSEKSEEGGGSQSAFECIRKAILEKEIEPAQMTGILKTPELNQQIDTEDLAEKVVEKLINGGYPKTTPIAVIYKATWPDEKVVKGTLEDIASKVKENDIKKTALIMVGEFLGTTYNNSKLYDKDFKHEYRK